MNPEIRSHGGVFRRYPPLLTDLYELTMLAGYLEEGMAEKQAVFDLFFRTNPFEGGYAVFAGLEPALDRQLAGLPQGCLRFINPHRYKVSISGGLNELRNRLIETVRNEGA